VKRVDGQQRALPAAGIGPQLGVDLGRADAGRVEQLTALGQAQTSAAPAVACGQARERWRA
jgi:hypothetical protein